MSEGSILSPVCFDVQELLPRCPRRNLGLVIFILNGCVIILYLHVSEWPQLRPIILTDDNTFVRYSPGSMSQKNRQS